MIILLCVGYMPTSEPTSECHRDDSIMCNTSEGQSRYCAEHAPGRPDCCISWQCTAACPVVVVPSCSSGSVPTCLKPTTVSATGQKCCNKWGCVSKAE